MDASFDGLQVTTDPNARILRAQLVLTNRSGSDWPADAPRVLGWQLYDPESAMFIQEGEWVPVAGPVANGANCPMQLEIALPPERGLYHVYLSLLDSEGRWGYTKGDPFVLLEAEVRDRQAQFHRGEVVTAVQLRRRRLLANIKDVFRSPIATLVANRTLLTSLVRRDVQARYRGSFGDMLWTIINPLLLMATYFFVFGVALQSRLGTDTSRSAFALYFLAGMLPWLPFSEALARAPHVIVEHRTYVKKLVFPLEILPATQVVAALVTEAFAAVVFLVCLLAIRGSVPATVVLLPVLVLPQVMFTLGLSWFLSALGVFLRDLTQVMGMLLTLWFFLTPICYPVSSLPEPIQPVLTLNPIYVLVDSYRRVLLDGRAPDWTGVAAFTALALAAFFGGYAWFHKLRKTFPDVI